MATTMRVETVTPGSRWSVGRGAWGVLNSGKIAATLSRAGQIIKRKSIDQREQTLITEENPPSFPGSIPTGELTPWPPQHKSKPTAAMPQRSTGPKTDGGKARVRRNAFKHGMTARTIMPVLPQEDPKELEDRT